MKTIRYMVLTAMLVLCGLACKADYMRCVQSKKWWIVAEVDNNGETFCYWKIYVNNYETVGGKMYYSLVARRADRSEDGNWVMHSIIFPPKDIVLYESNGAVYNIVTNAEGEEEQQLLYSLDMESGNDVPDSIVIEKDGKSRKCVYLGEDETGGNIWIVEGIGANTNFWSRVLDKVTEADPDRRYFHGEMVECHMDDKLLFSKEDFDSLVPPGQNGVGAISEAESGEAPTVDLQGRPVSEMRSGEIYVTGGKKVMKR